MQFTVKEIPMILLDADILISHKQMVFSPSFDTPNTSTRRLFCLASVLVQFQRIRLDNLFGQVQTFHSFIKCFPELNCHICQPIEIFIHEIQYCAIPTLSLKCPFCVPYKIDFFITGSVLAYSIIRPFLFSMPLLISPRPKILLHVQFREELWLCYWRL